MDWIQDFSFFSLFSHFWIFEIFEFKSCLNESKYVLLCFSINYDCFLCLRFEKNMLESRFEFLGSRNPWLDFWVFPVRQAEVHVWQAGVMIGRPVFFRLAGRIWRNVRQAEPCFRQAELCSSAGRSRESGRPAEAWKIL